MLDTRIRSCSTHDMISKLFSSPRSTVSLFGASLPTVFRPTFRLSLSARMNYYNRFSVAARASLSRLYQQLGLRGGDIRSTVGSKPANRDDILNFTPCPQGRTSPLVVSLAPRGVFCLLGGMLPLCSTPGVNTHYCLEEWRGEQIISPPPRG
jgi:hypothetical protein